MNTYDYIIVGAGHNGLTAAAYLSRKGKVLVLERRDCIGGQVITEDFGSGLRVDSLHPGGTISADVVRDLKLYSFGLPVSTAAGPFIALQSDSNHLVLDRDPAKAAESIKRFSANDAETWPAFVEFMKRCTQFIHSAYSTIMPRLPMDANLELGKLGFDLRRMGAKDMMKIMRGLPMTAVEFVEEWFESEPVKAAVASLGIYGVTVGVMGAGTGFNLMHNWTLRGGMPHAVVAGGVGKIGDALAAAVKSAGGEIRTNAQVKSIVVDTFSCKGVVLATGEEIAASKAVISAADPKHTFLSLVGPVNLPPEFVWQIQSIKMRGSVCKIHLLTDGRHGIPQGTLALAPSLKYLEKAYDAAKYHGISENPYLELTTNGNTVSIHFQYGAYRLRDSNWDAERKRVEQLAIGALGQYFPGLKDSIQGVKALTPKDIEEIYGVTEGDLNHGQLMLDQFLFMRPIPGWSNHKTPLENLYLCGSGVHGGGGISGVSGRNVARVIA